MTEPEHANRGTPRAAPPTPAAEERPFTDYGQFGVDMIDTRVLWQDQVWVDRLGNPHALHEMSQDYRANVIAYLHRRAPEWHLEALIEATAELADALAQETDRGDLRIVTEQAEEILALDPVQWVEQTPLMAALRHQREASG